MLDQKIRAAWDRIMHPVGSTLGRAHFNPNVITFVGLALQGAVAAFIIDGRLLVAGLVAIGSGVADILDGAVAKALGKASKWGALLDSTTDRVSDALFFLPVAWLYGVSPDTPGRDEPWVAALAMTALVASFLVSYVKARAEGLGYECNVGLVARAERAILMIAALILADILPVVLGVLALLSIVTVFQRLVHVFGQVRRAA